MNNHWLIADTHFGHESVIHKFHYPDGSPLRPFKSVNEMNVYMAEMWNQTVKDQDHINHVGDFCVAKRHIQLAKFLRGHKRLWMGNHDEPNPKLYIDAGFERVGAYRPWGSKEMIFSHVPLHFSQIDRFGTNVHGHQHSNYIDHPGYLCVSVEHTGFKPINLDEVRARIAAKKKYYETHEYTGKIIIAPVGCIDGVTNVG